MANDFSLKSQVAAYYRFESGALTTDSKGSNTLTDNNTCGTDTTNYKEGSASLSLNGSNEYMSITDANLSSDFPLKNGTTNKKFSVCFWIRETDQSATRYVMGKYDATNDKRTFGVLVGSNGALYYNLGYDSGTQFSSQQLTATSAIVADRFYHVTLTYDEASSYAYTYRIWDDYNSSILASGNDVFTTGYAAFNGVSLTDVEFCIGRRTDSATAYWQGQIDGVVFINNYILKDDEADDIRRNTYHALNAYRVQSALAAAANPTATFTTTPSSGNLLVAACFSRTGTSATSHVLTGWTKRIEQDVEMDNVNRRRSMSVWTKIAGASESTSVQVTGDDTVRLIIQEFVVPSGYTVTYVASEKNNNGTTENATSLATGTTSSLSGDRFLVLGIFGSRRGAHTATWSTSWASISLYSPIDYGDTNSGNFISSAYDGSITTEGTKASTCTISGTDTSNTGLSAGILGFRIQAVFPVEGILDEFNRIEQGPPPSTNWWDRGSNGLKVYANELMGETASANNMAVWKQRYGNDIEVYTTIDAIPGAWETLMLEAVTDLTDYTGYCVQIYPGDGVDNGGIKLYKTSDVAEWVTLKSTTLNPSGDDKFGMRIVGSDIEVWYKTSSGSWQLVWDPYNDSTYTGEKYLSVWMYGTTSRLDSFGGGGDVISSSSSSMSFSSSSKSSSCSSSSSESATPKQTGQVILGGTGGNPTTSAAHYYGLMGQGDFAGTATEEQVSCPMPTNGKFTNLIFKVTEAPGAGKSWTLTIRKNGEDTALSAVISGASDVISALDTDEVSFSAGDLISLVLTPSGTPSPFGTALYWSCEFLPSIDGETILLGHTSDSTANVTRYYSPSGRSSEQFEDFYSNHICPTRGTFKKLYLVLVTAPGSGKAMAFTGRKSSTNQTLSVNIADENTTGNDVVNTFSADAGDTICLAKTKTSTPAATYAKWGLVFLPDIAGEFFTGVCNGQDSTSTRYHAVHGSVSTQTVESETYNLTAKEIIAKKIYAATYSNITAAKNKEYVLRVDAVDTLLAAEIIGGTKSGNSSSDVTIPANSLLSTKLAPNPASPLADNYSSLSFLCYKEPVDNKNTQVFVCAFSQTSSTSAASYVGLEPVGSWGPTENQRKQLVPCAGVFKNFKVKLATAPGVGKEWVFTVRKNEVATDLSVTISGTNTTSSLDESEVSFSAGDFISIEAVPSGTPANAAYLGLTLSFTPTTAGETFHCHANYIGSLSIYMPILGYGQWSATEANTQVIMPCAGTFKKLYAACVIAPGSSYNMDYTLRVNGVSTDLTARISAANTTGNNTSDTVAVSAGDLVCFHYAQSTGVTTTYHKVSITFVPNTLGDFTLLAAAQSSVLSTTAIQYSTVNGIGFTSGTEASVIGLSRSMTVKNMYSKLRFETNENAFHTFTLRKNNADTVLTKSVTDDTRELASSEVSVADDDILTVAITPSIAAAAVRTSVSYLFYQSPSEKSISSSSSSSSSLASSSSSSSRSSSSSSSLSSSSSSSSKSSSSSSSSSYSSSSSSSSSSLSSSSSSSSYSSSSSSSSYSSSSSSSSYSSSSSSSSYSSSSSSSSSSLSSSSSSSYSSSSSSSYSSSSSSSYSSSSSSSYSSSSSSSSSSLSSSSSSSSTVLSKEYSRGDYAILSDNDSNLTNLYTEQEYIDVAEEDLVYVTQPASSQQYALHLYKDKSELGEKEITLLAVVKTNVSPITNPVYLQIYNRLTDAWVTVDTEDSAEANVDFTLSADITSDTANYFDEHSKISCRIYQESP